VEIRSLTNYTCLLLSFVGLSIFTVITPKNWNLFSVNVFMAATGLIQLYRKVTAKPVEALAVQQASKK
jgi:hypothetical protein